MKGRVTKITHLLQDEDDSVGGGQTTDEVGEKAESDKDGIQTRHTRFLYKNCFSKIIPIPLKQDISYSSLPISYFVFNQV
jgi:hypothetical protein